MSEMTSAAARTKAKPTGASAGLDQSCLQHVLGYQLAQAEIPTTKIFARSIGKPLELRPVEFTILLLLAHNRDVTQKQLAQTLAVAAPGMTSVVAAAWTSATVFVSPLQRSKTRPISGSSAVIVTT